MHRVLLLVCCLCALAAVPSSAAATHGADLDCSAFVNQAAAQSHFAAHPGDPDRLDGNTDGRVCEALPCPCSGATTPPPGPNPTPGPAPAGPPPVA
ncbi:hypothetical protein BH20ACT16_BH20ACT16_05340 [soil metagenome]|jgi:hypothetical protein